MKVREAVTVDSSFGVKTESESERESKVKRKSPLSNGVEWLSSDYDDFLDNFEESESELKRESKKESDSASSESSKDEDDNIPLARSQNQLRESEEEIVTEIPVNDGARWLPPDEKLRRTLLLSNMPPLEDIADCESNDSEEEYFTPSTEIQRNLRVENHSSDEREVPLVQRLRTNM